MNLLRSVARSMSILAGSQALMWVAAILFTIAQATYLGPARFGELSVALSYAALLAVLIEFGLGTQLTRLVSQRASGHEEALAATVLIKGGLWLLAMPLVALATLWFGYPGELRETILTPNFIEHAEGSVFIQAGRTRVICTASVEDRLPFFLRNSGRGWVTAEYAMLPRSTQTRTQREVGRGHRRLDAAVASGRAARVRMSRAAAGCHPENGGRGGVRRAGRRDDGRRYRHHAA